VTSSGREAFWFFARIFVGLIFAYAGLAKLLEPAANFEAALLKYGVFSPVYIPLIARVMPWFEWILGSFLMIGYAPRLSAALTALLSLGFLVTLASSPLFLGAAGTDCGCFGASGLKLSIHQIFGVDLASLAVSLKLLAKKSFPGSLDSLLLKGRAVADDIKKTR